MADEQVSQIVRQVMSALRMQGAAVPAGRAETAAPPKSAAKPPPQRVFLTADMLRRRLAAGDGDGRTVELAPNEFLTPAAADLADERHLTLKRQSAPLIEPAAVSPAEAGRASGGSACQATMAALQGAGPGAACPDSKTSAVGLVVSRPNEAVRTVLASLRHDGLPLLDYSQTDCWIANTHLLCEAVATGRVRAGVAILPHAAEAMVLANKIKGIRAVQGARADGVAAAMRQFAPNVLVLEHALSTYHEMRAMVRLFAGQRPARPAARVLMEALTRLEGA